MLKRIGRSVRVLSLVLAGLCFVGFAAFGALCLVAALGEGVDETLKKAGLQAAIISFTLALTTPFLQLIPYGLGVLIDTALENAKETKKTREILQSALADGLLSTDVARKCALALDKTLSRLQPVAASNENAPVQRPVAQPATVPVVEEAEEDAPDAEEEISVERIEDAVAQSAQASEEKPRVQPKPAAPFAGAVALRPLSGESETF